MFSFRCCFYPKSDGEEFFNGVLSTYLAALVRNGQMVGDWNIANIDNHLEMYSIMPAEDSLDSTHSSEFVMLTYEQVLNESVKEPEIKRLGQAIGLGDDCRCESPSAYLLFTTFLQVEPPVLCCDCGAHVPLYKLPHCKDETDYCAILNWDNSYKAFDRLCVESGFGEKLGMEQISSPCSPLSSMGLSICTELTRKLDKPVYYYIYTEHSKMNGNCPVCRADWRREKPLAHEFDLRCDKCGLISASPLSF